MCKQEYWEMKDSVQRVSTREIKKYKDFTEDRAKKLYEELMLQYLKNGKNAEEADAKAKSIIKKQCRIRGLPLWNWL